MDLAAAPTRRPQWLRPQRSASLKADPSKPPRWRTTIPTASTRASFIQSSSRTGSRRRDSLLLLSLRERQGEGAWQSHVVRSLTPPHPNLLPEGEGTRREKASASRLTRGD